MKRDKTGRFTQAWDGEPKQAVKLSLTNTAWQLLEQQARELGISRSELVERYARHSQSYCTENGIELSNGKGCGLSQVVVMPDAPSLEELLAEQIAVLQQHNGQLQDQIAELQQRVAALRSQEQRFRQISDAVPHMVWTCLPNGEVEYFNQQSLDAFGITLEQLLAEGWEPLVHPDDLHRTIDTWTAAVATGTRYQLEYRLKMANGSYRWYLAQALPQRDETGQINRWFGTCTEIEERKCLEQRLQQQADAQTNERQWLEAVLNLLPTPLILVDPEQCRVTFSNQAANAIAGVDLANEVGATYNADYHCRDSAGQVIPPDQIPAVRAARGEKIAGTEINWHTPVGDFPLLVDADTLPAMYGHPATSIIVFQNICERKQIEEQLQESQRFIQQVADATPGILYIYDLIEQHNVYANRQIGEILGYTPDEVQAMGDRLFPTLMHPEDLATLPAHMERFDRAQDGEVVEREYRLHHADGEWRWLWSRDLVFSRTPWGAPHQVLGISHDITDRKRAELVSTQLYQAEQAARASAEASEQHFRCLAESIPQMIWVAQANGFTEYYNQRWFQYTGLTLEESQSVNGRFCHPDDHDAFEEAWIKAVTNKEILQAERRLRRADGTYRWHLTRAFPLLDEHGEIVKWFGSCTNIDDWKRMEQTQRFLAQQAEQARQRAERTADRTARLQAVTAALSESLTPVQVAEVIAHQTMAVVNGVAVLVALVTPQKDELEVIHFLGDKIDITTEWRRFPLTVATPLTDAVRTKQPLWEETLEERIARYPHLAERYAQVSYPAWISLPLIVEGQAVGGMTISFAELPHLEPDDRAFMLSLAQQCAQAIARAQLYEAEQQARSQAEAANRTKDEFLAVLSHELRTPMNPILGWASLLQQGNLDANRTAIALKTIERNAKLQVQLIEDLLDISRILQGKLSLNPCPVSLAAVIDDAIATVRLAADAKAIQIHTLIAANADSVLGDAARLQQVVWNLLSNAVKFTPAGGQVEVKLESYEFSGISSQLNSSTQHSALTTQNLPNYVQITVTDTGKGIRAEFLPFVFDTFRQADSSITRTFGGLGLGLAICRHLVELHGGTIQVESAGEGHGATFTVKLPLLPTSTVPAPEAAVVNNTLTLQGIQVLAVDDEIDNLELATFILEQAGAAVVAVSSAPKALQVLTQMKPNLLLLDIGMPHMDGYTLLGQIRTLEAERGDRPIPAIALTAYAGEVDQQQALAAGFQQHLPKPVEPEVLLQAILGLICS